MPVLTDYLDLDLIEVTAEIDVSSPLVRANLGLRFILEAGLFACIAVASIANYGGATAWTASVVGIAFAAGVWGVFAVPNDPSRSGKTVVVTPGAARLAIELGLFAIVTAWLIIGESYIPAVLLAGGAVVHYAAWPARIRWLLAH